MANTVLGSLLKEYEQKRLNAELELEKRKAALYKKEPKLEKIEAELSKHAIKTAKSVLKNDNKDSIKELNKYVEKLKKEKQEILKKEKLDTSYLKPQYECKKCQDTGYITNKDYSTSMCSCLKQRMLDISYNKSNMANLKIENFKTFNINKFSNKANPDLYKTDISPRENMKYIKEQCEEFVKEFDNPEYKNLLFTGNVGLRKNLYV